jgi:hypothetical protein
MKDERRANDLIELSRKRYLTIDEIKEPYRQVEEYNEIIQELIFAFMCKSGETNKSLIDFAKENLKILTSSEISIIEDLKLKRDRISFYGEIVPNEFLNSRKSTIDWIIEKLLKTS